jgi:hypothetical protein
LPIIGLKYEFEEFSSFSKEKNKGTHKVASCGNLVATLYVKQREYSIYTVSGSGLSVTIYHLLF